MSLKDPDIALKSAASVTGGAFAFPTVSAMLEFASRVLFVICHSQFRCPDIFARAVWGRRGPARAGPAGADAAVLRGAIGLCARPRTQPDDPYR